MTWPSRQFLTDSRIRAGRRCSRGYAGIQKRIGSANANFGNLQTCARFQTSSAAAFEIDPRRGLRQREYGENNQIPKTVIKYRLSHDQRGSKKMLFYAGFKASRMFRPKRSIPDVRRIFRKVFQKTGLRDSGSGAGLESCRRGQEIRYSESRCGLASKN